MTQEALAVEERSEVDPVAVPTPSGVGQPEDGPHEAGAVGGEVLPTAPEQHPMLRDDHYVLRQLRRPFMPAAVKWKFQSAYGENGGRIVAHIDARLVIERLNLIVGSDWQEEFEPLASGLMICRLTVGKQTHTDVGEGKGKALYSDALKRAAVKFGVGVSVYAIPAVLLEVGKSELRKTAKATYITNGGLKRCAEVYEEWLAETGIPRFGEPIDHGDVNESAGEDVPEQAETNDLSDVKPALTDEQADAARLLCREAYARIDKKKMPKARFESELRQASTSHDELAAFEQKLRGMAK